MPNYGEPWVVLPTTRAGAALFGFDELGTPIVTFEVSHPDHGPGWVLYINDGAEYFIGGQRDDWRWADQQARDQLAGLAERTRRG